MILLRFGVGHHDPIVDFWLCAFLIGAAGISYAANKLTNGFAFAYRKADISVGLKSALSSVHFLSATIVAFILPNNYLFKFKTFHLLYKYNALGIPISVMIALFVLLILIGCLITFIVKMIKSKINC